MATDSTNLTFVRCPSCRSLVPAISARCRMCGAALETADGANDPAARRISRVRQRTMSSPYSELADAAQQIRHEPEVEAVEAPAAMPQEDLRLRSGATQVIPEAAKLTESHKSGFPMRGEDIADERDLDDGIASLASEDGDDDPLGAFIEEVDVDGRQDAVEAEATPEISVESSSEAPPEPVWNPLAEVPAPAYLPSEIEEEEPVNLVSLDPVDSAEEELPEISAEPVIEEELPVNKPKVVVETGLERKGVGLSFGARASRSDLTEEPQQAPEQLLSDPLDDLEPISTESYDTSHSEPVLPPKPDDLDDSDFYLSAATKQEEIFAQEEKMHVDTDLEESKSTELGKKGSAEKGSVVRHMPDAHGRLFGWLVSYADPDGQATELREGKFFITAKALKDNDLIITDPSISTPHSMVTVGGDLGLVVQDLMSDRGIFLRRRGRDTYVREYGSFEVNHGDWLRFGDVEFLITLIAHVGME